MNKVGPLLGGFGNRGFHPLEPLGMFGPDKGFQSQRLGGISQIDRGDVAPPGRDDLDRPVRRRVALPARLEAHCARLRPDAYPTQFIAVTRQHQVDPGTRSDFQALETRGQTLFRQPQHGSDEAG